MAGKVRQPIDIASLERFITANVPEIAVPLDVKQVCHSSELVARRHGKSADESIVRLWTVKPNISIDGQEWQEVCYEEEASGQAFI